MHSMGNSNKVRRISGRVVLDADGLVVEMAKSIYANISQEKMELLRFLKTNEEVRMDQQGKSQAELQERIEVS
jgi:signal-transduction protein with cAMP-binding, CBS, and nucleotidyltransferase domain